MPWLRIVGRGSDNFGTNSMLVSGGVVLSVGNAWSKDHTRWLRVSRPGAEELPGTDLAELWVADILQR